MHKAATAERQTTKGKVTYMLQQSRRLAVAALAAFLAACGSGSNGTMSVHLVDGPGSAAYTGVKIEVLEVSIHSDAKGWITLCSPREVIDLLTLTRGADKTLCDGVGLPVGHYGQMRLLLGEHNSVVLPDGSEESLKVPSGQQSGVKLDVSFDVALNTTKDVFIDFDAHKSVFVHETGNGKWMLRPVVRAYDKVVTGAILGTLTDDLSPAHALPGATVTAQVVDASGPNVVRTTTTDAAGKYTLDLLPVDGTYYVVAQPVLSQPVAGAVVFHAEASGTTTITAAAPVATQNLAFASAGTSFGSLGGTVQPPLGANEADVVSVLQVLPAGQGGALQPFIVRLAAGSYVAGVETFALDDLPFGDYSLVVTRQGEDTSGNATFTSASAVAVIFNASTTTLVLAAP
jgi:hypothetical protein